MSPVGLYCLFAKVSALTFGGGYAMVPLFRDELVVKRGLLAPDRFADLMGLAQITPGPIGLNAATYVGMSEGGLVGAAAATLGVMTPSFVFALAAAFLLRRLARNATLDTVFSGIRPCVLGIIASAVVFFADTSVFNRPFSSFVRGEEFSVCWQGAVVFALATALRIRTRLGVAAILLVSAAAGCLLMGVS